MLFGLSPAGPGGQLFDHFEGTLSEADAESLAAMLGRVGASLRDELEGSGRCEV